MTIENKIYTLNASCEVISGMEAKAASAKENLALHAIALIASNSTVKRVRTVMKARKFWAFMNGHFDANAKQERTASNILEAFTANELTSTKLLAMAPKPKGDPLNVKIDKTSETITKTESASDKLLEALLKSHEAQGLAIAALAKRSVTTKEETKIAA
mgnify:CR=1 FL=1